MARRRKATAENIGDPEATTGEQAIGGTEVTVAAAVGKSEVPGTSSVDASQMPPADVGAVTHQERPAESLSLESAGDRHGEEPRAEGRREPFGIASDKAAGVVLQENREFHRMQLRFVAKPGAEVLGMVKEAGYRWNSGEQAWTKQLGREASMQIRIEAQRLFRQVVDFIRAERGLGEGRE
ncbi:MAG: hypothetical protein U1D30_10960 [Planctomycetota bacterium]